MEAMEAEEGPFLANGAKVSHLIIFIVNMSGIPVNLLFAYLV